MREDKHNKGRGKDDLNLDDLMDNNISKEEQEEKARLRRKRRLEEDKRGDRVKQARQTEKRRAKQKAQHAAQYKLEKDIESAKTFEDINKINLSAYDLPPNKKRKMSDMLDKAKRELEVEKYEKELEEAKRKQAPGRLATKALPLFLQPISNFLMDKGLSKEEKKLKKAKRKKRNRRLVQLTGVLGGATTFLLVSLLLLVLAGGSITSILLSHPEAIRELYQNDMLGDAMYMGNVTEDVVIDGKVVVKGNPAARPGCFIYNGVWYCGNCKVVDEGASKDDCDPGSSADYSQAGQGSLTVEATEWAKTFEATFIGDSLGVGVEPELSKAFPKMNFDVLSSRWLIYQSEDSTDGLNGLHALREMAKANQVKDILVVALGTNGGLSQDDLKTFMGEVPDNVKQVIFINSGSKGGSDGYGNIDYEDISKQIKDFSGSESNVGYLDWLTFSHKEGWDELTSDSVHLNGKGNDVYAKFITQGLYDIINGGSTSNTCSVGDLGDHNITSNMDSDNLRDGVSVYESEGIEDWPRKIMNMGTNIFADITEISGYRAGDPQDHGQGLAIDFMVPVGSHDSKTDLGDIVAQWGIDNFDAMNLDYIIWEQRIYGSWNKTWQGMEDRHTVTLNHFDHPHFSFKPGSGDLSSIGLPTKGEIELPDVVEARGGTPEGLDDVLDSHTHGEDDYNGGIPDIEMATIDTSMLGDTDISNKYDLYGMDEDEYLQHKMESQLIVARGDEYTGTSSGPGRFHDTEGFTPGMMAEWDLRAEDPEWLTGDYIDEFLSKNGYDKQPQFDDGVEGWPSLFLGKGDYIIQKSQEYGIAAGAFLGQVAMETSFGRTACGSPNNFGCMKRGTAPWRNWPSVWTYGSEGGTQDIEWEAPPTIEEGIDGWFDYVKQRYIDQDITQYAEFKETYAPGEDGLNASRNFEGYMFGTLRALGYDLTDFGVKAPGTSSSNNDTSNFVCPDNCTVTEEEKSVGTGNVKALPKGKTWENDNILIADLGYMSDTVTPEAIDEFIEGSGPSDNGIKGFGKVFYDAGLKSGYDPRYLLAHMIHETDWGRSTIWVDKNNAYGWMAYDDTPYDSAKDFETKEKGIIEGGQMIYKNYYVDHEQKNLQDMNHDPDEERKHNYATDPEWYTKIGNIMLETEKYMGPSNGGSVVQGSNTGQQASTDSGVNLGRSCSLEDVTFNNLPYPPEEMVISSFFHDGNYPYGPTHGGADMTYSHGGEGPIYSVDDGEVTAVETGCGRSRDCGDGWGNYIKIKHPSVGDGGYETQYAHLKSGSIDLKVGDKVTAGQEIATMGTTGQSDGIHLHFELWHNGARVDNYPHFAWEDATYTPGWDNYAGPHTGDPCTPGGSTRGQQSSDNRSQTCEVDGPKKTGNGLIGDTEAEQVYHFFSGHGFSDAAIAGILGNLMQESGVRAKMIQGRGSETKDMTEAELDELLERSIYIWSDPSIPGENLGPAVGISQWEHDHHDNGFSGRWEGVMAWSAKNGYSHWDTEAQLEYIIREMGIVEDPDVPEEWAITLINTGDWACNSDEGCIVGIQGFENFMKTDDVEAAVRTYFQFNRAGHAETANRYAYAKEFYAEMANWK